MRIRTASKTFTAILTHRFNSRGYRTYWQQYGVNFISSVGVLYYVRDRKQEIGKEVHFELMKCGAYSERPTPPLSEEDT
jgi:hypothetical protein